MTQEEVDRIRIDVEQGLLESMCGKPELDPEDFDEPAAAIAEDIDRQIVEAAVERFKPEGRR